MSGRLSYRADIDGLRAIAVLSVIGYHFGMGPLPGGFTGVDVFFVISGYLITLTIWGEMAAGTFSLRDFYIRRVLRILPAMIVMVFSVLVAGYFMLWPSDYASVAVSAVFSLAGLSNFYFFCTSDYFAQSSDFLPLLHTWSLGVEEQFYLIWPLALLALGYRARRGLALALGVVAIGLTISLFTAHNPPAAFFLPWARMWELAIGCSLAFIPPIAGRALRNAMGLCGLALLLAAFTLNSSDQLFYLSAVHMSCIGAALIIAAGQSGKATIAAKVLRLPGVPSIGRMSYSLYLWHWPILVFYRHYTASSTLNDKQVAALLLVTFVISVLSRRFIERPFIDGTTHAHRWQVRSIFIAAAVLISASIAIRAEDGFAFRIQHQIARVLSYQGYDLTTMFRKGLCFMDWDQDKSDLDFATCLPHAKRTAVLWGSSMVAHLYFGLEKPFADHGYVLGQLTGSSCRPIPNIDIPDRPKCRDFNHEVFKKLLEQRPDWVIIGGMDLPQTPIEVAEAERAINELTRAGIAVDVLGYSPVFNVPIPQLLASRLNSKNESAHSIPSEQYDPTIWAKDMALDQWINDKTNARYVSLLDILCPNQECGLLTPNGVPKYVDHAHMSREGSSWFGEVLAGRLFETARKPAKRLFFN